MLKITATGNLGKDQVTDTTPTGKILTKFSIASTNNKVTTWLDCSYWSVPDKLLPYLVKGAKVIVEGDFSLRESNGKTYPQVTVRALELIGGKTEEQRSQHTVTEAVEVNADLPF